VAARIVKKKKFPGAAPSQPRTSTQLPDEAKRDAEFSRGWVTVRMYRDILGDCFLLRFPAGNKTVHMLIDCGILQGMPGAKERARRIMANVQSVTSRLDVLVATHEHVDHLSGFAQAREFFDKIEVDELWLAWTEDPRDDQANRLRAGRTQAMTLLERSYTALAGLISREYRPGDDEAEEEEPLSRPSALDGLRGLMAFSGRDPGQPAALADTSTAGILEFLRTKAKRVRFFSPGGDAFPLVDLPGVTTYVLGPPREESMLKRSNPRKSKPEVYELNADTIQDDVFLVAALGAAGSGQEPSADELARLKLSLPFGFKTLIATDTRSQMMGAQQNLNEIDDFNAIYHRPGEEWRRIDSDWLGAAEQLALKLDSDTNNTSLVLAIEIGSGPESRVLLFPGDAQLGNWLSWGDYAWPSSKKADERDAVRIEHLLSKTILYKVGHHGSHNATLRERGLELMTHRDLVAMIPVQQEFANETKNWNMPFPSLLKRLEERTGGRVIRADRAKGDLETVAAQRVGKTGELGKDDWERFLGALREISDIEGAIALEYRIPTSG
jgi:beta-lactamase superfamily II metal-dependent hydrolase